MTTPDDPPELLRLIPHAVREQEARALRQRVPARSGAGGRPWPTPPSEGSSRVLRVQAGLIPTGDDHLEVCKLPGLEPVRRLGPFPRPFDLMAVSDERNLALLDAERRLWLLAPEQLTVYHLERGS